MLKDLKDEFDLIQSCVGFDVNNFSGPRQVDILTSCHRLRVFILPDLESQNYEVSEFALIVSGIEHLVNQLKQCEKEKQDTLHYNLKAMVDQVQSVLQSLDD